MGIQAGWHDEGQTIILNTYDGEPTLADFYRATDESYALMSSQSHTVHEIIDLRNVKRLPPNLLSGFRYAAGKTPSNQGVVVIIGLGTFMETLVRAASRIYPAATRSNYVAGSMEEAERIIQEHALSAR
jgi:hypothetical protein